MGLLLEWGLEFMFGTMGVLKWITKTRLAKSVGLRNLFHSVGDGEPLKVLENEWDMVRALMKVDRGSGQANEEVLLIHSFVLPSLIILPANCQTQSHVQSHTLNHRSRMVTSGAGDHQLGHDP
jgi:hypothetical protein